MEKKKKSKGGSCQELLKWRDGSCALTCWTPDSVLGNHVLSSKNHFILRSLRRLEVQELIE